MFWSQLWIQKILWRLMSNVLILLAFPLTFNFYEFMGGNNPQTRLNTEKMQTGFNFCVVIGASPIPLSRPATRRLFCGRSPGFLLVDRVFEGLPPSMLALRHYIYLHRNRMLNFRLLSCILIIPGIIEPAIPHKIIKNEVPTPRMPLEVHLLPPDQVSYIWCLEIN